jgi:hypothetical protein
MSQRVVTSGLTLVTVACNMAYAGMRAQNNPETSFEQTMTLMFGLPGTLVTMLVVEKGSERAYGVDLPRKNK